MMIGKILKNSFLFVCLLVILSSFTYATCTVTFDEETYNPVETVEATMICDSATEKSQAYTLTWTNSSGYVLKIDTGTTPATISEIFFKTYQIPKDYNVTYGTYINATLTGTNLEGSDFANVTNITGNTLVINDCQFKPYAFIGSDFSVDCSVTDIDGNNIDNAQCVVYGTDTNNAPLQISEITSNSINGRFVSSGVLKPENMKEGTSYLAKILCNCKYGDNKCWNDEGTTIEGYQGKTSIGFTTAQWLSINTLVGMNNFEGRQVATICANVTSIDATERINTENYYKVWCGSSFTSLDRVVISATPTDNPDRRGINTNTTINHCYALMIPEKRWMQGRVNNCLASSEVWVLNNEGKRTKLYTDSSDAFNITITDIGINPDWSISNGNYNVFTTTINMSSDKYNDYTPELIGNMDIRLDMHTSEYVDAYTDSIRDGIILFDHLKEMQDIESINVSYCNGTILLHNLEITNEGFVEIEIPDINLSTACVNINVTLKIINDRTITALEEQADALEDIANKTGTFHFSLDCPTDESSVLVCYLYAQVEDSQTVEKEVDFTCYIDNNGTRESSLNFNQMITKDMYTKALSFSLSKDLIDNEEYQVICRASYYNLGSRTDTFYDSFVKQSSGALRGMIEGIPETIEKVKSSKKIISFICAFVIISCLIFFVVKRRKRKSITQ